MGQKVHPFGFRLGIFEDWKAHWFVRGPSSAYAEMVKENMELRRFLDGRLTRGDTSSIDIDKAGDAVKVTIHTTRPGAVIGKKGQGIEALRNDLEKRFGKKFEIAINEIKSPDLDAKIVAEQIAMQIERRASIKRVLKKFGAAVMRAGAKGVKIRVAGRLGGAEIARAEWFRAGSVPLHTLRAEVDYATAIARTTYGVIGIKVWICRGMYRRRQRGAQSRASRAAK